MLMLTVQACGRTSAPSWGQAAVAAPVRLVAAVATAAVAQVLVLALALVLVLALVLTLALALVVISMRGSHATASRSTEWRSAISWVPSS